MVRRCVVGECNESDQTLLSHRFPKLPDVAKSWQNALDLQRYSIDELQKKFVVCTKHFTPTAYRNAISNSLNCTAIPNLNDNSSNERIHTTNQASKKEISAPIRCHKLPTPSNKKIYVRPLVQPAKRFRSAVVQVPVEIVNQENDEEEETIGILEYSQDEPETQIESEPVSPEIPPMKTLISTKEASTITDTIPPVQLTNEATQTDPEPEIVPPTVPTLESKDDKILSILYPEFKDKTKVELVDIINEKCQKIESLEDKVKKLELAMRNLL